MEILLITKTRELNVQLSFDQSLPKNWMRSSSPIPKNSYPVNFCYVGPPMMGVSCTQCRTPILARSG